MSNKYLFPEEKTGNRPRMTIYNLSNEESEL